ncbi:MAG: hypothetical protein R6V85_21595 [Polyangia bacterium]
MKSFLTKIVLVAAVALAGAWISGCVVHAQSGKAKPAPTKQQKAGPKRKAAPPSKPAAPAATEPEEPEAAPAPGHNPPPPPPPSNVL